MTCGMGVGNRGMRDNIRSSFKQLINRSVDALLISGNRRGGEDNRIAWNQLDKFVGPVGYPGQSR